MVSVGPSCCLVLLPLFIFSRWILTFLLICYQALFKEQLSFPCCAPYFLVLLSNESMFIKCIAIFFFPFFFFLMFRLSQIWPIGAFQTRFYFFLTFIFECLLVLQDNKILRNCYIQLLANECGT